MKQPKITLMLAITPIIIVAATWGGYEYIRTHAPKAITKSTAAQVQKEQQLAALGSSDSYFIGTSHYASETSSKSKIEKSESGDLYKITTSNESKGFLMAFAGAGGPTVAPGWKATRVGTDPMWIPGACAQKPSWMIGDHLILIDDGEYDGAKATHYYALYDTNAKTFTEFGGALANDTQAKEKILSIGIEQGKLVFYIDLQDAAGPYATSTSFKHSLAQHENFLIRRVIETPDLTYTDFRVPFDKPAFDDYHATVITDKFDPNSKVTLSIVSEGGGRIETGAITPSKPVALVNTPSTPNAAPVPNSKLAPYRDALLAGLHKTNSLQTIGDIEGLVYLADSPTGLFLSYDQPYYFDIASKSLTNVQPDQSSSFTLGAE